LKLPENIAPKFQTLPILPEGLLYFTFCPRCLAIISRLNFSEIGNFSAGRSAESEKISKLYALCVFSEAGG